MTIAYQKALALIHECIATKSPILNLGGLALSDSDVPSELWELHWLEELNFQNYTVYAFEKKEWKNIRREYEGKVQKKHFISTIPPEIHKLKGLKVLLLCNTQISKIENLECLTQLQHLNLS